MATFRHVIEGIMLIICAIYFKEEMLARGMPEPEARIWTNAFVVIFGSLIIWLHRRRPPAQKTSSDSG